MASRYIRKVARVSQIFSPVHLPTSETTNVNSKSYKHFMECGIIRPLSAGLYAWLPVGYKAVEKLTTIVENEMSKINAQRMLLPSLIRAKLWKQTDRLEDARSELFMLKDRHNSEYILSPTHEEQLCSLLSNMGDLSTKQLPLRLYQISSKWRDERRPRTGFIRSREFLMKDLYTFDTDLESARKTYDSVCEAYDNIFQIVGIDFHKAIAGTGMMGGSISHEYHYLTDFGDDTILSCSSCDYRVNKNESTSSHCPQCKTELTENNALEVGHTFLLETKYTKPLQVSVHENNKRKPAVMGCYGLGIDRIITAAVEILSTNNELRWPKILAPYTVCIIPPKKGSKEEPASQYVDNIIEILDKLNIDIIIDDRTDLTVGRRSKFAQKAGYPYAIVICKTAMQENPLFEVHDIYAQQRNDLSLESVYDYFKNVRNTMDLDKPPIRETAAEVCTGM